MALTAQFVNKVDPAATVRLDLNDGSPWVVMAGGTATPPPALRRAVQSNLLADGVRVTAAAYESRTVTIALDLHEPDPDAAATALQELARELDRPFNILRWAPGTSEPVYFKTFRSDLDRVQWDLVARRVTVRLLCEPFAMGELETLGPYTYTFTPLSGGSDIHRDITGVIGDVPARCKVKVSTNFASGVTVMFATRRRGTPSGAPFLYLPANFSSLSADTSVVAGPLLRTTFATSTALGLRGKFATPDTDSVDIRGRYRVFARIAVTAAKFYVMAVGSVSGWDSEDEVTTNGSATQLVDLGEVYFPDGPDPVYAANGEELPVRLTDLTYNVGRHPVLASSGNLDLSYMALIPTDDQVTYVEFGSPTASPYLWDGEAEEWYGEIGTNSVDRFGGAEMSGKGYLELTPNQTNRLYILPNITSGVPETIGSKTITITYHPRYLHVRPVTT